MTKQKRKLESYKGSFFPFLKLTFCSGYYEIMNLGIILLVCGLVVIGSLWNLFYSQEINYFTGIVILITSIASLFLIFEITGVITFVFTRIIENQILINELNKQDEKIDSLNKEITKKEKEIERMKNILENNAIYGE